MTGAMAVAGIAVALALLRAPSPVRARLRALRGAGTRGRPLLRSGRIGTAVPALLGAGVMAAWAALGAGAAVPVLPAVAGATAGATGAALLAANGRDRRQRQEASALVESVGLLAADLRAGAEPAEALRSLGADPAAQAVARHRAVTAVWAVAGASGAPTAAVLDQVERDLRTRDQQRREVGAQLAGARSTGAMLAVLPVLGLGMGAAMGADPLSVLLGTTPGQLALVAGVALDAVGVLWTMRIVARAEVAP
jgi:tight adherence protein B